MLCGQAGDIVQVSGLSHAWVTHTLAAPEVVRPLHSVPIDPPTISMVFGPNTSPFAGKDGGTKLTSAMVAERLHKETRNNVSISVVEQGETNEVHGRGEMQLGILVETMRREGFELSVSPPSVLYREEEDGTVVEPVEEVVADVDEEHVGVVMEKLSSRMGELIDMRATVDGRSRLTFHIPSRCLVGYRSAFTMDTRGRGVLNTSVQGYQVRQTPADAARRGRACSHAHPLFLPPSSPSEGAPRPCAAAECSCPPTPAPPRRTRWAALSRGARSSLGRRPPCTRA